MIPVTAWQILINAIIMIACKSMNQTLTIAGTKSASTCDSTPSNKPTKVLPNVITNSSSSDRSIRRLSDAKSTPCILKETLDKVEGYSIVKGGVKYPFLGTHNIPLTDHLPIFACKTFLPASCECGSTTDCEIDFSQKAEKEQQLRLKSGVHSNSWCATNDKIDVYNIIDSIEHHLELITRY